MVQTQFQVKIQVFQTDNGKKKFSSMLGNYLTKNGIIHQSSCVDTAQQNRVAKRKNKHLLEVARSLMFTMGVSNYFWGEAILTAYYLINRLPTSALKFKTPIKLLQQLYPMSQSFTSLPPKVFGCVAFVHDKNHNKSKLDPRSLKCVFVGYSPTQKEYKCFHLPTKKYFVTMDVTFF